MNHTESDLRGMFDVLSGSLEDAGCPVAPVGPGGSFERDERGHFSPPRLEQRQERPCIRIIRDAVDQPGDAVAELLTLAHEAGHFDSWHQRTRPSNFEHLSDRLRNKVSGRPLSTVEQKTIWNEEIRAWEHARDRLEELGFTAWEVFGAGKGRSLASYRQRLPATQR